MYSRADHIAERAEAMKTSLAHENEKICKAAARFLKKAKEAEDREREWETQLNGGDEPRFE
jgi:regulator of protease activity HflC (stomatin/prohibitin superfamily)